MTWFYFWVLMGIVGALLLAMTWRPARVFEYPYFMALVFGIFILPQAVSLLRFPGVGSEAAVTAAILMCCLCLSACILGYQLTPNRELVSTVSQPVNQDRLLYVGIVFVICGFVFQFFLSRTDVQFSERGGMTGTGTILLFFQQLVYPGFAICLLDYLRRPRFGLLVLSSIAAIMPMQAILNGRREPAAMFLLIIGMGLFFRKRVIPPTWLVLGVVIFAMLAIPATGTYRGLLAQKDWDAVRQVDLVGNFRSFIAEESILELRNAAILIEATQTDSSYQYGAGYWNHFIFRFVPAQLVGRSIKDSLMIGGESNPTDSVVRIFDEKGYDTAVGSTVTGMGDSFQQFGWFGWVFFFAMAILFRILWQAALLPEAVFAQIFYIAIMTSAMRSVTHWTLDFLPGVTFNAIFLGAAFLYARESSAGPTRLERRRVTRSIARRKQASLRAGRIGIKRENSYDQISP